MIADLPDRGFMHERNCPDLRAKNYQFAAVGHDRLELVHSLSSHPQILVNTRCYCKDLLVRAINVGDVDSGRVISRPGPRFNRIADEQAHWLVSFIHNE